MKIRLHALAHGRAGDKGDTSTISVIAYDPRHYPILQREVTAERVQAHFASLEPVSVERFELPGLCALNFVLRGALGGGVTRSLALDAHGKALGCCLLDLELDAAGLESEPGSHAVDLRTEG